MQSAGEVIAQALKEMIYEGRFKPGEPLRQDSIAEIFGVSRVPVRDAFNKLVSMQLALSVPRKGIVVQPLSRRLLRELFDVRIILEGAAAELMIIGRTPELIETLSEIVRHQKKTLLTEDVKASEMLDETFHRTLRGCIDNQTLTGMIEANWMRIKHARCASSMVLPASGKAWMKQSIARHERLIAALESGDREAARKTVCENIAESYQEVISTLEQMKWLE